MRRHRPLLGIFPLILAAFAICGVFLSTAPGFAQANLAPAASSQKPSEAAKALPSEDRVRSLIDTLEDDEARQRLIDQLNTLLAAQDGASKAPPPAAGARFIDVTSERISRISEEIVGAAAFLSDLPKLTTWFENQFVDPAGRVFWVDLIWKLAVVLIAGAVAEWIVRTLLLRPRRAVESRADTSYWLITWFLCVRTLLDVLPLVGFAIAAYVSLPLTEPDRPTRLVALAIINAYVIARVVSAAALAVLTPRVPALRLVRLSDETSNYLFIWVRRFANIAVYGYFLAEMVVLLGMPESGYKAVRMLVALLLMLLAIVFILQNRPGVANWLRSSPGSLSRNGMGVLWRRLGDIWHVLAIVYVVVAFVVWAMDIENGSERMVRGTVLTMVIIALIGVVSAVTARLVERGLSIGKELSDRFPGLDTRANRYLGIVHRTVRWTIYAVGALAILEAWGIDSFAWVATDAGRRVIGSAVIIALTLIVSVLIWELVNSAVERYLSKGADGTALVSARAMTLLPLVRSATMIVLATLAVMVVLSEIGVNIGPLLAGVGVIGLAVGFGAQALVKDIITGFFILSENQIAVGDVVRVGSHAGLVERMTIRTLQLRDLAGNVHIVPFSEVSSVENMTKEYSRYVFDVGVAYREDTDEVVEVLKALGEEMVADPEYGPLIVAPLEILGVDRFADSAVIVRARITTQPIKQWQVGREFNRRMKKRFDERGIEIPFPHRTVYFGADKQGSAPAAPIRLEDGNAG